MRFRRLVATVAASTSLVAGAVVGLGSSSGATPRAAVVAERPLRILVTNDDGVAAAGIDRLVERLRALPNVEVSVIAPATNQSGAGEKTTATALTVANTTTASGYPARSVNGFPADTVLVGVLALLPQRPDIVVSGINIGQNIGEAIDISGTVGAARAAGRLGIPSIAVSQGLGAAADFDLAARLTTYFVALARADLIAGRAPVELWNLNLPTCATGSVRGLALVPSGRAVRTTGYTTNTAGQYTAVRETRDLFSSNCTSTKTTFVDDVDAMMNGFASLTELDIDGTADNHSAAASLFNFAK
jgi:5'-nucleotidase